jgi:hypothetical protein
LPGHYQGLGRARCPAKALVILNERLGKILLTISCKIRDNSLLNNLNIINPFAVIDRANELK